MASGAGGGRIPWKMFRKIGVIAVLVLLFSSTLPVRAERLGPRPTSAESSPEQDGPAKHSHITPEQAKELFRSVTTILNFVSDDTKLPILHPVKRKLVDRSEVHAYILRKFHHSKDAREMEHEEVLLKKFGFLAHDFQLRPFLVGLLTEQIAGYYDDKTKTVNLLDWVAPDEQKPVIAHELTHALQDQRVTLSKWEKSPPFTVSKNVREDNRKIQVDEQDTARDAVLEGQAMTVYLDYRLAPTGRSVRTSPEITPGHQDFSGSPMMARAPKLLQESLLFPYTYGLAFEQRLLKDHGPQYAFAGVLDDPPSSSYQIMTPLAYEEKRPVPVLYMPDIHSLIRQDYQPYDIGVMGELDVRILGEIYSGPQAAAELAPQWDGGIYFAAQSRSAKTPEQKASTASIAFLYLSAWRSREAARTFMDIFGQEIENEYSSVTRDRKQESGPDERVYQTNEGPILMVRQGRQVFVSESFGLDLARKLQLLLFGAQQNEPGQLNARNWFLPARPDSAPAAARLGELPMRDPALSISRLAASFGLLKAAMQPAP